MKLCIQGHRDEDGPTNNALAVGDAERLRKAGIAKIGTDEEMFNTIMASRSFAQLRVTFNAYEKVGGDSSRKKKAVASLYMCKL